MHWSGYRPNPRRFRQSAAGGSPAPRSRSERLAASLRLAGLSLALLTNALAAEAADKPTGNLFYHPSHGFQIPFEIDPADKPFVKSIELYVSSDQGRSWRLSTATSPKSSAFKFRATGDGEYWFAVRTLDIEGRYNPADDKPIMPGWRVIVDTSKPGLGLRSIARRGTMATIAWDARDEHLDLNTFAIEYSIPGSGEWKPVPIARPAPNGESTWDCGTAEPIRVRATVSDMAGNVQTAESQFGDGAAQRPTVDSARPDEMDRQAPAPIARMASAAGDRRGILGPQDPLANRQGQESDWIDTPRPYGPEAMTPATRGSESGRFPPTGNEPIASNASRDPAPRRQMPILNSPRFPMNYVVEDAGPNGPATVELWVTRDAGRNWSRWAEDEDRVSPMMVDLGGEGVFGLSIVARSLAGQGDEIPRSGTAPQISVEVDSTPPAMILNVIKVGVGSQSGKVLISWQAEDRNFGARPIAIQYRPETGNQWLPIVDNIENTGQYVWTPGPQVPPVFHIRVEARDLAGNRSAVDTTQYEPVLLDRSRPKGRILGINVAPLDSSGPTGQTNPAAVAQPPDSAPQASPAGNALPNAGQRSGADGSRPAGRIENFPANVENPNPASSGAASSGGSAAQPAASETSGSGAVGAPGSTPTPQPPPIENSAAPALPRPVESGPEPNLKPPGDSAGLGTQPGGPALRSIPPSPGAPPAIQPPSSPPSREQTPPPGSGSDRAPGSPSTPAQRPPASQIDDSESRPSITEPPPSLPESTAIAPSTDTLPLSLELPTIP